MQRRIFHIEVLRGAFRYFTHTTPVRTLCLALITLTMQMIGCAINYYDRETSTEHLWGFGHLQLKVIDPQCGTKAVVRGCETYGVAAGNLKNQSYLSIGVQRREWVDFLVEDAVVCMERPLDGGLFTLRLNNTWPNDSDGQDTIPDQGNKESVQ